MKPKKIYFLVFVLAVTFLVAVFTLRLKTLSHEKAQTRQELKIQNPAAKIFAPLTQDSAANEASGQSPAAQIPDEQFQKKMNECLQLEKIAAEAKLGAVLKLSSTPKALLENLKKSGDLQKSHFQFENYHLDLANGEERRIHLLPAEQTQSKDQKELRLFKLDSEGLPQPIKLSREQKLNAKSEVIEKLKAEGTVKFHQLKETLFFSHDLVADVEWINDETKDVQFIWNKKVFSCRELNCECR